MMVVRVVDDMAIWAEALVQMRLAYRQGIASSPKP